MPTNIANLQYSSLEAKAWDRKAIAYTFSESKNNV